MSRHVIVALAVFALSAGVWAAQVPSPPPPPPPPPEPLRIVVPERIPESTLGRGGAGGVRRVPIGTATLSGTIVAADSGRLLSNVRVVVTGQVTELTPATGGRAAGPTGAAGSAATFFESRTTFSRQVVSDQQGRFVLQALPAGHFTVNAQHEQYLPVTYGQTKFGGPGAPVQLAAGQAISITLRLPRGAVITGTIYGDDGFPLSNGRVQALRFAYMAGVRRLIGQNSVQVDDRGIYRLFGLQPGEYVVSATPNTANLSDLALREQLAFDAALRAAVAASPSERPTSVAITSIAPGENALTIPGPTYAPGTAFASEAMRITIGPGEERAGIDVRVLPVRMGGVQGVVAGLPAGAQAQVAFVNEDPGVLTSSVISVSTSSDGSFRMMNLAPGRYTVIAQVWRMQPQQVVPGVAPVAPQQLSLTERLWARTDVVVDGQSIARVALALQPPLSVSGSVVFQTARSIDLARAGMSVGITPAQSPNQPPQMGPLPTAKVEADGRFTLEGLIPGRYFLRPMGVSGFARSAIHNGDDVLDIPLVVGDGNVSNVTITMSDAGGTLSGSLTDALGKPASMHSVILLPQDRSFWLPGSRRIQLARPDPDGRYRFVNLPSGAYLLAALADIEPGGQFDPELLGALSSAALSVSIVEGATKVQDIRLAQ